MSLQQLQTCSVETITINKQAFGFRRVKTGWIQRTKSESHTKMRQTWWCDHQNRSLTKTPYSWQKYNDTLFVSKTGDSASLTDLKAGREKAKVWQHISGPLRQWSGCCVCRETCGAFTPPEAPDCTDSVTQRFPSSWQIRVITQVPSELWQPLMGKDV